MMEPEVEKVRMTRQEFIDKFYPKTRHEAPDLIFDSIHAIVHAKKSEFGMQVTGEQVKDITRMRYIEALERVKNEVMAALADIDLVDISDLITEVQ